MAKQKQQPNQKLVITYFSCDEFISGTKTICVLHPDPKALQKKLNEAIAKQILKYKEFDKKWMQWVKGNINNHPEPSILSIMIGDQKIELIQFVSGGHRSSIHLPIMSYKPKVLKLDEWFDKQLKEQEEAEKTEKTDCEAC